MRILYGIISILFVSMSTFCQIPYTLNMQGVQFPTGMSAISINENIFSCDTLPISKNSCSISYQPSRFGLSEISPISAIYQNKMLEKINLIAGADYFGYDLYNELAAKIGAVSQIKYLEIGAQAIYHRASIKDYGNSSAISIDLFSKLNLLNNLAFGLLLQNINRAYYSSANRTVPQSAIFSIGWMPFDHLGVDFGTNLDLNSAASVQAGLKYYFNQYLQANIKCNSKPFLIIAGANLSALDYLNILFYFRYDEHFGYDQILGIEFNF